MPLKPLERLQRERQWFGHKPPVLCNTRQGNLCCQLLMGDYTCVYRRDQFRKILYGPCRYTGFLTPSHIPNFCFIRRHIVIISPHAYRLLGTDYGHTETSISGAHLGHILVNLTLIVCIYFTPQFSVYGSNGPGQIFLMCTLVLKQNVCLYQENNTSSVFCSLL